MPRRAGPGLPGTTTTPTTARRTIAVDFDGTLCADNLFGEPSPGAPEVLRRLSGRGWRIVVHTCRARYPEGARRVARWCAERRIPVDEVTAIKPQADVYVDDRAVRFTTWADVFDLLSARQVRA